MAQFIEVRNAKTEELIGVHTTLKVAKDTGACYCGTDGFTLTVMQINVNANTIALVLANKGGYAYNTEIREYSVSEDGEVKEVK